MKKTVILIIVAFLFLVSSIQLFLSGDLGAGFLGLLIVALCCFFVFKKKKTKNTPTAAVAPLERTSTLYSAAPKIAGYIERYNYNDVRLATFDTIDFSSVPVGVTADIHIEPNNEYDNKAVYLEYNSIKLGYLYKGKLQDMVHSFVNNGGMVFAFVSAVANNEIVMNLTYYDSTERNLEKLLASDKPRKIVKLTGVSKTDIQENIGCCSIGDSVNFEYSTQYEKDAAVVGLLEIGFISSANLEYIESLGNYAAYVHTIKENDNGKCSVSVVIFE